MKRNTLWIALVALCTLALAIACAPISPNATFDDGHAGSATSSFGIEGTSWTLASYLQDGELVDVPEDITITATFGTDGTFSSQACNNINSAYVADGTMLTIQPGAMTLMACEGPLGEIESVYVQLLGTVTSHDVTNGVLSMSDADGNIVLTFVPDDSGAATADDPATLDGTNWILTDYGMDNTVSVVPEGVTVKASFQDGTHSAQVCNNINAGYTTEGNTISFAPGMSTMMMCEEPLMSVETAYLAALEDAATWSITDGQLIIFNANGGVLLAFSDDLSVNADPAHTQDGSDLAGTAWQVTGYLSDGALATPDSSFAATLLFSESAYSGQVCNSYGGDYTTDGNNITFGTAVMTMMACMGPVGDFEPIYHTLLASATSFELVGNELTLVNDAGEVVLQFAAYTPPSLEGPIWNAAGINNGNEAVVSPIIGTSVTATFAGGTVSGSAGCNTYSGSYTLDGENLSIGPLATTRMACSDPAGVMEQETQFLTAMENVATWEVVNDTLWLRSADGAQQVNMIP